MNFKKILPPRLKSGMTIGIIAPADPVAGVCPDEMSQLGYQYLKDRGFSVVIGESVKTLPVGHTAGSAMLRANDINEFFKRKDIDCIMAFWGGFNTNSCLEYLDYELIKANPKIVIGYSDVTALTSAITTKTGLVTFSGPGIISFAKPEPFDYTWEYFEKICINPSDECIIEPSLEYADDLFFLREDSGHRIKQKNEGVKIFKDGMVEGEIVAGNLQTLLLLNGTEYLPDMKDKILFIEEDETSTTAHIDRYLTQCKQMGWFNIIGGLVLGRFTEQSGFTVNDSIEKLLEEQLHDAKFPVLYNVDFGHADPLITIPNGGIAIIDTSKRQIIFKQAVE